MIVLEQRTWWRQLWVWHGTALERIWARLVLVTVASTLLTLMQTEWGVSVVVLTPLPFTLVSVAIGIFLGFRNSASYDRFWEGRKLWGELVNAARTWARQVHVLVDAEAGGAPTARQRELVLGAVAFTHLLRAHLRDEADAADAGACLPSEVAPTLLGARHRPNAALRWLGEHLRVARLDRGVDPLHVPMLEATLGVFTNVMGACERIKSTPLPASYSVLIHRIVAVYVFSLPLGLVDVTGSLTPAVVLFIAYAFLGLDAIGDELENPFGFDANDLPLSAISRNIEIDLRSALGEEQLPSPILPVRRVLR